MPEIKIKQVYDIDQYGVFVFHDDKKFDVHVGLYSENKSKVYLIGENIVVDYDASKMTDITKGTYRGLEIRKLKYTNLLENKNEKSLTFYVRTSPVGHNLIGAFEYDEDDQKFFCSLSTLYSNEALLKKYIKRYLTLLKKYNIELEYFCDMDGEFTPKEDEEDNENEI